MEEEELCFPTAGPSRHRARAGVNRPRRIRSHDAASTPPLEQGLILRPPSPASSDTSSGSLELYLQSHHRPLRDARRRELSSSALALRPPGTAHVELEAKTTLSGLSDDAPTGHPSLLPPDHLASRNPSGHPGPVIWSTSADGPFGSSAGAAGIGAGGGGGGWPSARQGAATMRSYTASGPGTMGRTNAQSNGLSSSNGLTAPSATGPAPPSAPVQTLFKRLELVGRGAYGAVYRGVHVSSGTAVALKVVNLDTPEDDVSDIQREVALLSQLRETEQKNVVRYWGCWLKGHELWIVMDFAEGGSVRTLMKAGPIAERYCAVIVRESLVALAYLHKSGIIHRDIKAANILLTVTGKVLLCDFGVAASLSSSSVHAKRTTFVGTPYWMAPEVITEGKSYDQSADVWSLGITVYEMATGNPPLADQEQMRAVMLIPRNKPPRLPTDGNFSPLMRDFVASTLNEEAKERPSAEELARSNKWIRASSKVPTSILKELISNYAAWTKSGGMRMSLLGAEAADLSDAQNRNSFALDGRESGDGWEFNIPESQSYSAFAGFDDAPNFATSSAPPPRDHPLLRLFDNGEGPSEAGSGGVTPQGRPAMAASSSNAGTVRVRPGSPKDADPGRSQSQSGGTLHASQNQQARQPPPHATILPAPAPSASAASAPSDKTSFMGSGNTPFRFGGGGGGGALASAPAPDQARAEVPALESPRNQVNAEPLVEVPRSAPTTEPEREREREREPQREHWSRPSTGERAATGESTDRGSTPGSNDDRRPPMSIPSSSSSRAHRRGQSSVSTAASREIFSRPPLASSPVETAAARSARRQQHDANVTPVGGSGILTRGRRSSSSANGDLTYSPASRPGTAEGETPGVGPTRRPRINTALASLEIQSLQPSFSAERDDLNSPSSVMGGVSGPRFAPPLPIYGSRSRSGSRSRVGGPPQPYDAPLLPPNPPFMAGATSRSLGLKDLSRSNSVEMVDGVDLLPPSPSSMSSSLSNQGWPVVPGGSFGSAGFQLPSSGSQGHGGGGGTGGFGGTAMTSGLSSSAGSFSMGLNSSLSASMMGGGGGSGTARVKPSPLGPSPLSYHSRRQHGGSDPTASVVGKSVFPREALAKLAAVGGGLGGASGGGGGMGGGAGAATSSESGRDAASVGETSSSSGIVGGGVSGMRRRADTTFGGASGGARYVTPTGAQAARSLAQQHMLLQAQAQAQAQQHHHHHVGMPSRSASTSTSSFGLSGLPPPPGSQVGGHSAVVGGGGGGAGPAGGIGVLDFAALSSSSEELGSNLARVVDELGAWLDVLGEGLGRVVGGDWANNPPLGQLAPLNNGGGGGGSGVAGMVTGSPTKLRGAHGLEGGGGGL